MPELAAGAPNDLGRWVRQNAAATFGVIGSALTIFSALEPFLKLSRLAVWLVDHWRELIQFPWLWLGELIHIRVPPELASVISLCVFVAAFARRSHWREPACEAMGGGPLKSIGLMLTVPAFMVASALLIVQPQSFLGFVVTIGFAIFVAQILPLLKGHWPETVICCIIWFGLSALLLWASDLVGNSLLMYYVYYLVVALSVPALLAPALVFGLFAYLAVNDPHEPVQELWMTGANNAVRVTLLVIGLVGMNWIGLHAPAVKGWIDRTTGL